MRRLDEQQVALTRNGDRHQALGGAIAASCTAPARDLDHRVPDGFDTVAVEEHLATARRTRRRKS
jgi:hypothetical protein